MHLALFLVCAKYQLTFCMWETKRYNELGKSGTTPTTPVGWTAWTKLTLESGEGKSESVNLIWLNFKKAIYRASFYVWKLNFLLKWTYELMQHISAKFLGVGECRMLKPNENFWLSFFFIWTSYTYISTKHKNQTESQHLKNSYM